MATGCSFHGKGACHVGAMNWKACSTAEEFMGANTSLWQTARYQEEMGELQKFLGELYVYDSPPIVWTDKGIRRNRGPLYLVCQHGGGGKRVPAHLRWRQWGCVRCGCTTNQLYPASWDYGQCLAGRQEEVEFLLPMLRQLKSFRAFARDPLRMRRLLGLQEASPLHLACNNAAIAAQPPAPLPAAPSGSLPAPPQFAYICSRAATPKFEAHEHDWERYWYAGHHLSIGLHAPIFPESDCTQRSIYRNLDNVEAGTHEPPIGIEVTDL